MSSDSERRLRGMKPITPCLSFDTEGEDAAKLYTSIVPNSRITDVNAYGVAFELNGQPYFALNGGPQYRSPKLSRSRSSASRRRRSTATGVRSARAASPARVDGSRIVSASRGRSSRRG